VGLAHARLPRLAAALDEAGVHPSMYAAQWAMTLFLYGGWPFPLVARVWDVVLCEGWKGWFRVALAALAAVEPDVLAARARGAGFEGVMDAFKALPARLGADAEGFIAAATGGGGARFTRADLAALDAEYDAYARDRRETCGPDAGACLARGGRR